MDKSLQRTVLWPTLYAQSFTCFDCSVFVVDGKCFFAIVGYAVCFRLFQSPLYYSLCTADSILPSYQGVLYGFW